MTRLKDIADELGVPLLDVLIVARCHLDPAEFDDDAETVTDAGRKVIEDHFRGGVDPVTG